MSTPASVPPEPHTDAPANEEPPQAPHPSKAAEELPTLDELTLRADRLAADIRAHVSLLRDGKRRTDP